MEGGLWHPWRRKWAAERKDMPLKDVAAAGGWRDPNTLLKCYQQSDEQTLTRVVLEAGKLGDNGMVRAGDITPPFAPPARNKNAGYSASVLTANDLLECPA